MTSAEFQQGVVGLLCSTIHTNEHLRQGAAGSLGGGGAALRRWCCGLRAGALTEPGPGPEEVALVAGLSVVLSEDSWEEAAAWLRERLATES